MKIGDIFKTAFGLKKKGTRSNKRQKRDIPMVVRLSKEEVRSLKEEASALGLSVSGYIRMLVHEAAEADK